MPLVDRIASLEQYGIVGGEGPRRWTGSERYGQRAPAERALVDIELCREKPSNVVLQGCLTGSAQSPSFNARRLESPIWCMLYGV